MLNPLLMRWIVQRNIVGSLIIRKLKNENEKIRIVYKLLLLFILPLPNSWFQVEFQLELELISW